MTGFSGAGGEAEEHTALHGKPPPDDKATSNRGPDRPIASEEATPSPGEDEIFTQIFSLRNAPVATHSRFAALGCDDQVECDSRTAATPSERLTFSALTVNQASLPDVIWWLEHNQAELQASGHRFGQHDALSLAAMLRHHQSRGGSRQPTS